MWLLKLSSILLFSCWRISKASLSSFVHGLTQPNPVSIPGISDSILSISSSSMPEFFSNVVVEELQFPSDSPIGIILYISFWFPLNSIAELITALSNSDSVMLSGTFTEITFLVFESIPFEK